MAILSKTLQCIEDFEQRINQQDGNAIIILAKTLQRIKDLERKIDLQNITIKRQQTSINALINKISTLQPAIPARLTSLPAAALILCSNSFKLPPIAPTNQKPYTEKQFHLHHRLTTNEWGGEDPIKDLSRH